MSKCHEEHCSKSVKRAERVISLLLQGNYTKFVDKLALDAVVEIVDSAKAIPYAGTYAGRKQLHTLAERLESFVQFDYYSDLKAYVKSVKGDCHKVVIKTKAVQHNRRSVNEDFFPTAFNIEYIFTVRLRCDLIKSIKVNADNSALAIFYQYNTNPGGYEKFKNMMVVGTDQIGASPLTIGYTDTGNFFLNDLGLSQQQYDQWLAKAMEWFLQTYGLSFPVPLANGGYASANFSAFAVPIRASGGYHVYFSSNPLIPTINNGVLPKVTLFEFAVTFAGVPPTYNGTYAPPDVGFAQSGIKDTLAYLIYRIEVPETVFGPAKTYIVYARNNFPGHADYLQGPNSNEIGHSIEHFDLYSEVFGPGSSTLDVAINTQAAPDAIPALFRQTWFFPGSYNVPYYNAFTEAPIQFNPNQ